MKTIHFFLDFDGTISTTDVVDRVLEKFADKQWRQIESEWAFGKIGSRECLSKQWALVHATEAELDELLSKIEVDPHFVEFLHKAEELGVLVTIVSDGFDYLIEKVLKNNIHSNASYLKALPIFSNRLQKNGSGFKAVFAHEHGCSHGCANCKPAVMKKLSAREDLIFFVGDGLSDRYAAKIAHGVFAKGKLAEYCQEKKLAYIPYVNFKKITDWLVENHALLMKMNLEHIPASPE